MTLFLFGLISLILMIVTPAEPISKDTDHPQIILDQSPNSNPAEDLRMAKGVQEAVMTLPIPKVSGLTVARYYQAARWIGGDFAFFHSRENTDMVQTKSQIPGVIKLFDKNETFFSASIGDVAGHGVSSALIMALTTGLLSEVAQSSTQPQDILEKVNSHLAENISQSDIRYVTCIYLTIYPESKRLQYCRAGHPPGFVIRNSTSIIDLEGSPGVFLGMFQGETFDVNEIDIEAGDRIVIYSDGITETRNQNKEEFGLDRLKQLVISTMSLPPNAVLDRLKQNVDSHGASTDDQTVVIIDIA